MKRRHSTVDVFFFAAVLYVVVSLQTVKTSSSAIFSGERKLTYQEAKRFCHNKGMSLPWWSLPKAELPEHITQTYWLGVRARYLKRERPGNVTSNDEFGGTENNKSCRVKVSRGNRTVDCYSSHFGAFCKTSVCQPCRSFDCHRLDDGSCLRMRCGLHNWFQAREVCWEMGGHLLDVERWSGVTLTTIKEQNKFGPCGEFWLAQHKMEWIIEGSSFYPDARIPPITNWHPSTRQELKKNCAVVQTSSSMWWDFSDCDVRHHVVCVNESALKTKVVTTRQENSKKKTDTITMQSDTLKSSTRMMTYEPEREMAKQDKELQNNTGSKYSFWLYIGGGALGLLLLVSVIVNVICLRRGRCAIKATKSVDDEDGGYDPVYRVDTNQTTSRRPIRHNNDTDLILPYAIGTGARSYVNTTEKHTPLPTEMPDRPTFPTEIPEPPARPADVPGPPPRPTRCETQVKRHKRPNSSPPITGRVLQPYENMSSGGGKRTQIETKPTLLSPGSYIHAPREPKPYVNDKTSASTSEPQVKPSIASSDISKPQLDPNVRILSRSDSEGYETATQTQKDDQWKMRNTNEPAGQNQPSVGRYLGTTTFPTMPNPHGQTFIIVNPESYEDLKFQTMPSLMEKLKPLGGAENNVFITQGGSNHGNAWPADTMVLATPPVTRYGSESVIIHRDVQDEFCQECQRGEHTH